MSASVDFNQTYLTADQLAVLKKLDAGQQDRAEIDAAALQRLKGLGFVSITFAPGSSDVVRITEPGRSFLIFNQERIKKDKTSRRDVFVATLLGGSALVLEAIDLGIRFFS